MIGVPIFALFMAEIATFLVEYGGIVLCFFVTITIIHYFMPSMFTVRNKVRKKIHHHLTASDFKYMTTFHEHDRVRYRLYDALCALTLDIFQTYFSQGLEGQCLMRPRKQKAHPSKWISRISSLWNC